MLDPRAYHVLHLFHQLRLLSLLTAHNLAPPSTRSPPTHAKAPATVPIERQKGFRGSRPQPAFTFSYRPSTLSNQTQ